MPVQIFRGEMMTHICHRLLIYYPETFTFGSNIDTAIISRINQYNNANIGVQHLSYKIGDPRAIVLQRLIPEIDRIRAGYYRSVSFGGPGYCNRVAKAFEEVWLPNDDYVWYIPQ